MKILNLFAVITLLVFSFVSTQAAGKAPLKCPSSIDPSWNVNNNKAGSACYRQVQKVRKLEFDPLFECSKEIRQRWQLEMDIAVKMNCET